MVFAHMVLGEMVPKNLTLTHPEATLRVISLPNRAYLAVARPLVRVLNAMANLGVRAFGVEPRDELASAHTAQELAVMVAASREEGTIQGFAAELLSGVLDFGGREVASVMVPRERICSIGATATPSEAEAVVLEQGHSRLPVVGAGGIDDVLGFLHAKDLLQLDQAVAERPMAPRLLRRMLVVPRERSLEDLLARHAPLAGALRTGDRARRHDRRSRDPRRPPGGARRRHHRRARVGRRLRRRWCGSRRRRG